MAGRLLTISGGAKPCDKSTLTIVPGGGWVFKINLAVPNGARLPEGLQKFKPNQRPTLCYWQNPLRQLIM
jgi:hypothetical protein